MGKRWDAKCVDCNRDLAYADSIYEADFIRGACRPVRCPNCEQHLNRELRVVPIQSVLFYDSTTNARMTGLGSSPLGRVRHRESIHECREQDAWVDPAKYPEMFGVTTDELKILYSQLAQPHVPVVVAVAPTGSGKSTYLPYRLLSAIECASQDANISADFFTRFGQIVVTQPRVAPTTGISKFVSEGIHGQERGIGWDIGYRFSGNRACDWRNKMVYVTDGTLINWLTKGDLDKIGLVMIDEAHERSNNIDVILSLLARNLPQYPHLKVVIASATIDEKKFKSFFDNALPGSSSCEIVRLSPKTHANAGYKRYFRNEIKLLENGREVEQEPLDYQPDVTPEFNEAIPTRLAELAMYVLKQMFKVDGFQGIAPDGNKVLFGDIVGFLHGEAAIDEAVELLKQMIQNYPAINKVVDVYPLYRNVDDKTQQKAIDEKADKSRTRVIVSSNMAETSLTIDGIVHVVDSGIIKMTRWDPLAETSRLLPVTHSKAGCKQRWGRAGRKEPGQAWCLYTEEQFFNDDLFPPDSAPEIERSALDQVVLSAKAAGGDNLTDGSFPWIGNPEAEEFERAIKRLRRLGALDEEDDLTELGLELRHGGENSLSKKLLMVADRFGCAIEMATVLPIMELELKKVFLYDWEWDQETKDKVNRAKQQLLESCEDDLELCLKLFTNWYRAQEDEQTIRTLICSSPYWREFWPPRLTRTLKKKLSPEEQKELLKSLRIVKSVKRLQQVKAQFEAKADGRRGLLDPIATEFRLACLQTWAKTFGVDPVALGEAFEATEKLIDELGASKKENERRDINYKALDRLRALFAWSLRDQAYVRVEQDSSAGRQKYIPFSLGSNRDDTVYEIDRFSAAQAYSPDAFVTFGPKTIKQLENKTLVYIPLVIAVKRAMLQELVDLDEFELGLYFAEKQLKPANQLGNSELATRLLMDQVYPTHSRVRCRVMNEQGGCFQVQVLQPLGLAEGVEKIQIANTRRLEDDERDERPRKSRSKSQGYMIRKGQTNVFTAPEEDPESNELLSEDSEEGDNPTDKETRSRFVGEESDKLIAQIKQRRFDGWLYPTGGKRPVVGEDFEAVVIGHRRGARAQETGIVLATTSIASRFRDFAKRYRRNDKVIVSILTDGRRKGGADVILQEKQTGAECLMRLEDFALFDFPFISDIITRIGEFQTSVEELNPSDFSIRLSALEFVDAIVAKMSKQEFPKQGKAVVIHTGDSWRYWIQIQNPNHPAIFIPGQIERHGANTGEPTPSIFQENQEISVIIQGLPEQSTRSVRNEPNSKETKFLKQFGIEVETGERPRLILTGRLTLKAYRRIRASDLSEEFQYAIGELHKKSNTFEAIYLRRDLDTLFPKGKKTAGTVFNINPDRVLVRLKEGILGQIDKNEITWLDDSPFIGNFVERDSSIRAVVLGTDFARQTVQLSLKRMTRDPWESTIPQKYQERKWVQGKVDGWNEDKNKAVWIELEPGLKGIVHQNDIAIPVPAKLGEVFSKDQTVRVKVKRVDRTRRSISLALFDLWGHIKKKYSPGMKCTGTVRGLNRHMAYVELAPGIEGTLHISKLSALAGGKRLGDPSEVVKKDHKLEVEVIQLNHEKESIELDVIRNTTTGKKRFSVAQSELPKRYGVGTSHVGRVSSIVGFGAFVLLESGVEGLIHISNLSDDYVDDVADHVSVGEQVKVRVVKFEIKNNKAAIGLSRLY